MILAVVTVIADTGSGAHWPQRDPAEQRVGAPVGEAARGLPDTRESEPLTFRNGPAPEGLSQPRARPRAGRTGVQCCLTNVSLSRYLSLSLTLYLFLSLSLSL